MSAACHRPADDENAALLPIKYYSWDAVSQETKDRPGHRCCTSCEVEPPMVGQEDAGYADLQS